MRYFLDSSVALKWVLPEADSTKAIRLRDEDRSGLHELLAPDIFPSEIANGLTSADRQRRIRPGESAIFLNDILSAAPAAPFFTVADSGDGDCDLHETSCLRLHLSRTGGSRGMRMGNGRRAVCPWRAKFLPFPHFPGVAALMSLVPSHGRSASAVRSPHGLPRPCTFDWGR